MDVGKEVLSGLQLSGSSELIDEACYKKLLEHVVFDINGQPKSSETHSTAEITEKKAAFALASFLIDCAKQDVSLDEIRAILEETGYSSKRIQQFVDAYQQHKESIRKNLSSISSLGRAQIVDVNWRLDYNIKNSQSEKVNQLSYLVNLHTQEPGESEVKVVSFTCSLEQLQDLVGKLKDAVRCVEKQVST